MKISVIVELLASVGGGIWLFYLDWKIALAVILLLWGNNLGIKRLSKYKD